MDWPFDQAENVAAITSKFVLEENYPILHVVHYSDDHSWAFTCGTTDNSEDGRVIAMSQAVKLDPTICELADLPPGWGASRDKVGAEWNRYELEGF